MSKRMYHPCHKLSVPSAKLFWCRHCMQMFEDAISRWKHSRKCHAIPGYKHKDQDARVVQLYVKPDKVSYTSNITPGQVVYHKPHVKKTSADLKCVICGTKFSSLYDMRRHVKEPCQKSDNSVTCKQVQLSDTEDDIESYSSLKIRRVEAEEEKLKTNTALSVLAEASQHVESLSHAGEVILEQVIEEVPHIIERIPQSAGNSCGEEIPSSFPWYQIADKAIEPVNQQPVQEVVVAYPRPQVKPELGTVVISLQSEDGKQSLQDTIDLQTIQDCVKDTALTLPVGQIIHIQLECSERYLQFVVGYQGIIWPVEEKCSIPGSNVQEQTTNTVLSRKVQPAVHVTAPPELSTHSLEENSKSVGGTCNRIELVNQPIVESSAIFSQEIVVTSEETVSQGHQYSEQQKLSSLLVQAENCKPIAKEVLSDTISPSLFDQNVFQVSLVQNQAVPNSVNQEGTQLGQQTGVQVATIPVRQAIDFGGLQAITPQSNTESLVEALLKGSVIVSPPTVSQDPTQIAVVEVSDQQVKNFTKADQHLLQSYQHITMASGEQLIDDLFGFAELTGENVTPTSKARVASKIVDKKAEVSPKFQLEKEKVKRDTDEVVVPILFEKTGVKKYKVLARHQVEDDDDIRRPGSSERASPNSEEQRKENINIKLKSDNLQKQKSDVKKHMKRQKIKGFEKSGGEHSLKSLKQKLNARRLTAKFGKLQKAKDASKDQNIEPKEKNIAAHIDKDPRAVNYEFYDDSDSNTELHKGTAKTETETENENTEESDTTTKKIQDFCEVRSLGKEHIKQNHLKVECLVKLRRDPSIENFYKALSDSDSKDVNTVSNCGNSDVSDTITETDKSDIYVLSECNTSSGSDESKTVSQQNSSEENRLKVTDMIYNTDIQVRKSGRLRSAKCASRYRGDYGIRADTYKQLVSNSKTVNPSYADDTKESFEENLAEQMDYEDFRAATPEISNSKKQQDSVNNSQLETDLCVADSQTVLNTFVISADSCKSDISSDEFTVLKKSEVDHSVADNMLSRIEACSSSEHIVERELLKKVNKKTECRSLVEMGNERKEEIDSLMCDSHDHFKQSEKFEARSCAKEKTETAKHVSKITLSQSTVLKSNENGLKVSSNTENHCIIDDKTEVENSSEKCDISETECPNITNEVPFSNMLKENNSCVNDELTNTCCKNASNELFENEEKETSHVIKVNTEIQTNTKSTRSQESDLAKERINRTHEVMQNKLGGMGNENTGYVHSVGKSVNKIKKRMEIKKPVATAGQEKPDEDISPEASPVKDAAKVLETLRQKLFESAGADVEEADKVPKQFESKLISSKQRHTIDSKSQIMTDTHEKEFQSRDSDSASVRSGKSTPRCSTPRSEASKEILEEVAKSLDVLHKAKRKSESKEQPLKKRRFEEKKFLLRSTKKSSDDVAQIKLLAPAVEDEHSNEIPLISAKAVKKNRSSRSSVESSSSKADPVKRRSSIETSDVNFVKKGAERSTSIEKSVSKPKPVKCSACSHIFKTKELLRKHFPCRIRQTRTWSQNKLRPNRAVKRVDNSSKKFVCKLPKSCKPEASNPRPQLLTYRKTKFRKVKGKRRRRLYQLIQDLKQKRLPVKWPHLSIVYDDLSFKEQCLYNLGLICVGNASEGLVKYTAEEITVFEQHRAKEKWMKEDSRTFEHSIPDLLKSLSDLNVSTEFSTDNQESDFFSPKCVISSPQENVEDKSCDTGSTTEKPAEVAWKEQFDTGQCAKTTIEVTDVSPFTSQTSSIKEREVPWCLSYMQDFVENKSNFNYEEAVEFDGSPGKIQANVSIQEYLEYIKRPQTNSDSNVNCRGGVAGVETSNGTGNISQLQTFTNIRENPESFEEAQELSSINDITVSVKSDTENNQLQKAVSTEVNVCTSDNDYAHEKYVDGSSESVSNRKNPDLGQQDLVNLDGLHVDKGKISASDGQSSLVKEHESTLRSSSEVKLESASKLNASSLEKVEEQEKHPSEFTVQHISSADLEQCSLLYDEGAAAKEVDKFKSKITDDTKSIQASVDRASYAVRKQETVKNVSPKKKTIAVPDIELFHQTAIIDDKFLASSPFAQLEKASEKDLGSFHSSANGQHPGQENGNRTEDSSSMKPDIHHDLIIQASGMLEDILEDVEQTVIDGENTCEEMNMKFPSSATVSVCSTARAKNEALTSVNISPAKGILKNVDKKTGNTSSSPVKTLRNGESTKENSLKSPGKKKIDFKTYAKRKGMIKEKDDNDKEYMRSESHHEIQDNLLGRLLDAVNVIDSIIEEHKDQAEPDDDIFSAITPEMAFEAAMLSSKVENNGKEESSELYDIESVFSEYDDKEKANKPYDIESVFPYTAVDNVINIEPASSAVLSERNENEHCDVNKTDRNSESKFIESHQKENDDIKRRNNLSIEYGTDGRLEDEVDKDWKVPSGFTSTSSPAINLNRVESSEKEEDTFVQETAEPCILASVVCSTVNTSLNIKSLKENNEKESETDMIVGVTDRKVLEKSYSDNDEMPNTTDGDFWTSRLKEENARYINKTPCVKNEDSKIKSSENTGLEENVKHIEREVMKSPDHIPKKRKMAEEDRTIKESYRDFTIKYEMNGIVVKENLLTGDKNVVEKSSPFRSSAESDSNFDQSSQSELDISSVIENDSFSDTSANVGNTANVHSIAEISSKNDNSIPFINDMLGKTEQQRNEDDYDILSHEMPVKSDRIATDIEDNEIMGLLEYKAEIDLNSEIKINTEMACTDENESLEDAKDRNQTECINISTSSPMPKENETITISDNPEEALEVASRLEPEPLPDARIQVVRKISEDLSIGSPPVLEKVAAGNNDVDEMDEDNSIQDILVSPESSPPILEPQSLEENAQNNAEQNNVKISEKVRPERHFLDVLGMVGDEEKDETALINFQKKPEKNTEEDENGAGKIILELYKEESNQNDAIGRHFSDIVSETADVPKTPKSKLQFLFDKSERGEVTLAQIKEILTPSRKGKKTFIPKESLLKIKSGIANLLSNVKNPVRRDPSWLKRDALSNYSRSKKKKRRNYDEMEELESSCEESDGEDIDYISNDSLDYIEETDGKEENEIYVKKPSKRSVADTILQMLTSLEDKGSIADNMSNLLDILAENLGFLGKEKGNEHDYDSSLDSDDDYSHSGETLINCDSSSIESIQKDLIADYLVEGDQPPSLDDIPTAGESLNNEPFRGPFKSIKTIYDDVESSKTDFNECEFNLQRNTDITCASLGQQSDKTNPLKEKNTILQDLDFENISNHPLEGTSMEADISVTLPESESGRKSTFKDRNDLLMHLEKSKEVSEQAKDEKHKASTIFKSITELNSIETDEESNSSESFDPVSMSVRLSELKALAKEDTTWEFNSDYNSDQDDFEKFGSDFESENEKFAESHADEVIELCRPNKNSIVEDLTDKPPADGTNCKFERSSDCEVIETETEDFVESVRARNIKSNVSVDSDFISKMGDQSASSQVNSEIDAEDAKLSFEDKNSNIMLHRDGQEFESTPRMYKSKVESIAEAQSCSTYKKEVETECIDKSENNKPEDSEETYLADINNKNENTVINNEAGYSKTGFNVNTPGVQNIYDIFEEGVYKATVNEKNEKKLDKINTEDDKYTSNEFSLKPALIEYKEKNSRIDSSHELFSKDKLAENIECRNYVDAGFDNENIRKNKKIELIKTNSHDTDLDDDGDTTETVAYDEPEGAKTDFTGIVKNAEFSSRNNSDAGCVDSEEGRTVLSFKEKTKHKDNVAVKASESYVAERTENETDTNENQETVTVRLQDNEKDVSYYSNTQNKKLKYNDSHSTENWLETKKRSTSFNIDSAFSDSFSETIAEKVKRNQRDRSKSVCYNFNPWLYYSAAYVKEVTKPAKKEISVFRSSILEKRAREKSVSPEKAVESCSSRKKRNSSVPKEADLSYQTGHAESRTNDKSTKVPERMFHLKPCTVVLPKLSDDIIQRYTNRKRKSDEDFPSENRPPIKVTIKLSQIVYPPNSPYGSTSVSSDACRSGYESCSEESESDINQLDNEHGYDCEKEMNGSSDIDGFENVNNEGANGISPKEEKIINREPLKIKMRTLLTKMNSCEETVDPPYATKGINHLEQLSGSLNESSSETNIEVSAGELTESEVLHDIKRECEKVKSRETGIAFYLSDSENEIVPNATKKVRQLTGKGDTEKQEQFGVNLFSETHVLSDCGLHESDVDFSDSDSDSQIQEEINKILNASNSEDFTSGSGLDMTQDTSTLGKGKGAIMKMIVSDLRLSESDSESEVDDTIKSKENNIAKQTAEGNLDIVTDPSDVLSHSIIDQEISCLENTEHNQIKSAQMIAEGDISKKSSNICTGVTRKASRSIKEVVSINPREDQGNEKQSFVQRQHRIRNSSSVMCSSEKKQNVTKNIFQAFDLSQEHCSDSPISNSEFRAGTGNKLARMNTNAGADFEHSSAEPEHPSADKETLPCKDNRCVSFDKSNQEATVIDLTSHEDINSSFSSKDSSVCEEVRDDEMSEGELRDVTSFTTYDKLVANANGIVTDAGVLSPEYHVQEEYVDEMILRKSVNIVHDTSNESETESDDMCNKRIPEKEILTLEESKELENVNAVKNLEEDTFQEVQAVQDNSDEDMIYYAVELSDDLETNEAVVNLESVELIEGPIIIENNETHEENILDTSVVQSHVNDQIELQNEPLNEQIVETLNNSKHCSELRINSTIESMTHIENPVYYPVVNDVKSKYLYGINEDSQSSNEVVEELVTDNIVSDNAVLQHVEHQVSSEEVQIFPEGTIIESSSEKFPEILKAMGVQSIRKATVPSDRHTDSCVDLTVDPRDASYPCIECKVYDEAENPSDSIGKRPFSNISENPDTRKMCSGNESLTEFKADGFTGPSAVGFIRPSADGFTGPSDLERTRFTDGNGENSFLHRTEECAMVVECSDENDYIITQNEHYDEDNVMDTT